MGLCPTPHPAERGGEGRGKLHTCTPSAVTAWPGRLLVLYLLVDEAGLDVQGEVACEGNGEQELSQEVVLDYWLHPLQAGQVWVLGGREDCGLLGMARQCGLWTDLVFMCKCLLQLGIHLDTDSSRAAVGWGGGSVGGVPL